MRYDKSQKEIGIKTDICIVGGGMSGICASIAAARSGRKVTLIQDRPVLGGNASSEIRMWICGARGYKETGIIEEILLENIYYNPRRNFHIWDSILFNKIKEEENINLLLNCSCHEVNMKDDSIDSVEGWQMTTYTKYIVKADYFIDCSGDSILALLSGAEYTYGREAKDKYKESIAPKNKDNKTMGHSLLLQLRETEDDVIHRPYKLGRNIEGHGLYQRSIEFDSNFWWIELGGEKDTIHDTEEIRDDLVKLVYGTYDYIKSKKENKNVELDFAGMLPGKRESIRCIGDYVLTQNDVTNEGEFKDIIAYGGWPMDDHNPKGFEYEKEPTIFHKAPSPFGIPYRCIYSVNIDNLFFAGRNISATHTALSSTRVMATCAILGQGAGEAAAMAIEYNQSPRGIYQNMINELKQRLMSNDATIPFQNKNISEITKNADINLKGDKLKTLLNGKERDEKDKENHISLDLNKPLIFSFKRAQKIKLIRLVFVSDLKRETVTDNIKHQSTSMRCCYPLHIQEDRFPRTMVKSFDIEYTDINGKKQKLISVENNIKRLIKVKTDIEAKSISFIPKSTHGVKKAKIYSMEVE